MQFIFRYRLDNTIFSEPISVKASSLTDSFTVIDHSRDPRHGSMFSVYAHVYPSRAVWTTMVSIHFGFTT